MEFTLKIQMDNAAFEEPAEIDGLGELERILVYIAQKINEGKRYGFATDINGNKVGEWDIAGLDEYR